MAVALPKRFGRYEIVERLAVGGMAELFRARSQGAHGFERDLVVKRILPHVASDPSFREMFIDEGRLSGRLQHPKIVQAIELGIEGDELFIAMELVDGIDVLTLLRQCARAKLRLPLELAVHIAHEILDALDYAHSFADDEGVPMHIVHRDISPGNVLLSKRGDVKLTDFGIARMRQDGRAHTEAGTLKGKFSYMSPEQVAGAELDARSDVFSVGTVLAEMLMGRHLFSSSNDLDVLLMVRDVKLERLDRYGEHIPPSLRMILDAALSRRIEDRLQSAAAFRNALGDWLFAHRLRVTPQHLAAFISEVAPARESVVAKEIPEVRTLSGPTTQRKQLEAEEAARIGRALFSKGQPVVEAETAPNEGVPEVVEDDLSDGIVIEEADPEPADARPSAEGDFETESPLSLLFRLTTENHSGRLVVGNGEIMKEAYFERGEPVFVRSNVPSERLGEYLVEHNVILREELVRALGVMPHFGGRLGDTLVGLGLIEPMDGLRFLAAQVRDKLVDIGTWTTGWYRWYDGEKNPWPAVSLHLDTLEILGRSTKKLDDHTLRNWGRVNLTRRPTLGLPRVDLRAFGLGDAPSRVYEHLSAERTLSEYLSSMRTETQQLHFLQLTYLLVSTRSVRFS